MTQKFPEPKGMLTTEQRNYYRWALEKLEAVKPCMKCGADKDRYGILPATAPLNLFKVHEAIQGVQEMQMDMVVLSCLNCGFITFHAQPVLDEAVEKFIGDEVD